MAEAQQDQRHDPDTDGGVRIPHCAEATSDRCNYPAWPDGPAVAVPTSDQDAGDDGSRDQGQHDRQEGQACVDGGIFQHRHKVEGDVVELAEENQALHRATNVSGDGADVVEQRMPEERLPCHVFLPGGGTREANRADDQGCNGGRAGPLELSASPWDRNEEQRSRNHEDSWADPVDTCKLLPHRLDLWLEGEKKGNRN